MVEVGEARVGLPTVEELGGDVGQQIDAKPGEQIRWQRSRQYGTECDRSGTGKQTW
jgi:hypothetical protein